MGHQTKDLIWLRSYVDKLVGCDVEHGNLRGSFQGLCIRTEGSGISLTLAFRPELQYIGEQWTSVTSKGPTLLKYIHPYIFLLDGRYLCICTDNESRGALAMIEC